MDRIPLGQALAWYTFAFFMGLITGLCLGQMP